MDCINIYKSISWRVRMRNEALKKMYLITKTSGNKKKNKQLSKTNLNKDYDGGLRTPHI